MTDNIVTNGRANKTKSAFRLEYSIGINIQATPERIWQIMTNAKDFSRWNSTIQSISGRIALGETIKLIATIAPDRTFNLKVVEFVPNQKMVWSDGNAIFKGVRTYSLSSKSDGSTDFTMAELYTGLMLPMIAGSLPDFGSTFEQYAADLKREAEKT